MTDQQTSLREAFTNERLGAADRYLSALAERLASDVEQKKGEMGRVAVVAISSGYAPKNQPTMSFSDPALEKVTVGEVLKMDGYKRLSEVCARPDVDMCLRRPFDYDRVDNADSWIRDRPFRKVVIFVELPYSDSKDAHRKRQLEAAQQAASQQKKKGRLKRFAAKMPIIKRFA